MTNEEIWLAYPSLVRLSKLELPAEVSLALARLTGRLHQPYHIIESRRQKLVQKYGVKDNKNGQIMVAPDSNRAGDFILEFGDLLFQEWEEDIEIEKVVLPREINAFCQECGHQYQTQFIIDAQVLMPLAEHFVEIAKKEE